MDANTTTEPSADTNPGPPGTYLEAEGVVSPKNVLSPVDEVQTKGLPLLVPTTVLPSSDMAEIEVVGWGPGDTGTSKRPVSQNDPPA